MKCHGRVVRQQDFGMDDAALLCVIVSYAIPCVGERFATSVGCGGNGRTAFAAFDNFYGAMVNRYDAPPPSG